MHFAENLKELRREHRLSQEELAEMLGVSRQAVSKWEQGSGYPEVEKLLILSEKLHVSLDSLMGVRGPEDGVPPAAGGPGTIRIISPHEGVILNTSKVVRSPEFKAGKNSPKYALYAADGNDRSVWGAQNTFLAWYRNPEDAAAEIDGIRKAMDAGEASYTLRYSVKCKGGLFRIMEE